MKLPYGTQVIHIQTEEWGEVIEFREIEGSLWPRDLFGDTMSNVRFRCGREEIIPHDHLRVLHPLELLAEQAP